MEAVYFTSYKTGKPTTELYRGGSLHLSPGLVPYGHGGFFFFFPWRCYRHHTPELWLQRSGGGGNKGIFLRDILKAPLLFRSG